MRCAILPTMALSPRGFLPADDPLTRLPEAFDAWERLAAELPKLIAAQRVRQAVRALPEFPVEKLGGEAEWWRAKVLISHVANCYLWADPPVTQVLPAILARPWHQVAVRLGMPPALTYADWTLHKWRRIDPAGPVALGNLALTQHCAGGLDEAWFVLVHVTIEAQAGPGLCALQPAQQAARAGDADAVTAHLRTLAGALDQMQATLERMIERCDPYVYYHRVRPYMFGWKNNPALPNGLIYEGVDAYGGKAVEFYGETGAQSTVIPSIDAALGIAHEHDDMRAYLRAMLDYAPPAHREFVLALEQGPSIRAFVQRACAGSPLLRDAYNGCVERVERFRLKHMQLAADYIFKQNKDAELGTGGTSYMTYLGKHTRETRASLLV